MNHRKIQPYCMTLPLLLALGGCGALGLSTSVGPSPSAVAAAARSGVIDGVLVVDLNSDLASMPRRASTPTFADTMNDARPSRGLVGPGDGLAISILEAPPAMLFGSISSAPDDPQPGGPASAALPDTLVGSSGTIAVPFAGQIQAAGRTTGQIEQDIARRLAGKAHDPQVSVRLVRIAATSATVVGDVRSPMIIPLTGKGERLLDAIAAAGGTSQPADKTVVQITRGSRVASMPLDDVIRNPSDNVILSSNDVVTAFSQIYSYTVLGAASKSGEVQFEATGITLAQALGRVGGLQDFRADPRGVFLFRWADPSDIPNVSKDMIRSKDGKIPVIYRIDMKNPSTYFLCQNFEMRDKDIIYVANSGISEFRQFFSVIASTVLPIAAVSNAVN